MSCIEKSLQKTVVAYWRMAGFLKMFGEEGLRKISKDPALSPFLNDPVFEEMIADIADHPQNITKYQDDPRLQPILMTILPMMLSMGPDHAPPAPILPRPAPAADAETEKDLGNECFRRGDFAGAVFHYNRAIQIDPQPMTYYSNKASALNKLGRFEDAMEAALIAIEKGQLGGAANEQLSKIYVKLANAATGCGKENGALTALHESLYLHEDPVVRRNFEQLQKKLKPPEK
jgi:stress-induced-phosphoprotein 1